MLVTLPNPFSLDTTTHPLQLQPIKAMQLQRTDTQSLQGRISRGRGMARCDAVTPNTTTVVACGVFVRKDCRRVLLAQDTAGTVTLHMGSGLGIPGFPCAGPLPSWQDMGLLPGDYLVYIDARTAYDSASAATAPVVIGHTYDIECAGLWGRDTAGSIYDTGPDGENDGGGIFLAPFNGLKYGRVAAHEPGNANAITVAAGWRDIGAHNTITASATGNMRLVFTDLNVSAYDNNSGYMAARVRDIT